MDEIRKQLQELETLLKVASEKSLAITEVTGDYDIHDAALGIDKKTQSAKLEVGRLLDAIANNEI